MESTAKIIRRAYTDIDPDIAEMLKEEEETDIEPDIAEML